MSASEEPLRETAEANTFPLDGVPPDLIEEAAIVAGECIDVPLNAYVREQLIASPRDVVGLFMRTLAKAKSLGLTDDELILAVDGAIRYAVSCHTFETGAEFSAEQFLDDYTAAMMKLKALSPAEEPDGAEGSATDSERVVNRALRSGNSQLVTLVIINELRLATRESAVTAEIFRQIMHKALGLARRLAQDEQEIEVIMSRAVTALLQDWYDVRVYFDDEVTILEEAFLAAAQMGTPVDKDDTEAADGGVES